MGAPTGPSSSVSAVTSQKATQAAVDASLRKSPDSEELSPLLNTVIGKGLLAVSLELSRIISLLGGRKMLGQVRPSGTAPEPLYALPSGATAEAYALAITNVSVSDAEWSVFHDDDGTTADETTALHWKELLPAGESVTLSELGWALGQPGSTLLVKTSVANALTFTVYGWEL